MFVISETQIDQMTEQRLRRFAIEMAERARRRHPKKCERINEADLVSAIGREIETARRYGFKQRREMERFTDLSMTLGFGFSEHEPWALPILTDEIASTRNRLKELENTAVFAALGC